MGNIEKVVTGDYEVITDPNLVIVFIYYLSEKLIYLKILIHDCLKTKFL